MIARTTRGREPGAGGPTTAFLSPRRELRGWGCAATIELAAPWVDHVDHVAKVAGIDHVCLGSDFDGVPATPVGLENVSKLPALTAELRRRGYAPGDVEKILGGNVLRVLAANEPAGR